MTEAHYEGWTRFYCELADVIRTYKDRQDELITNIKQLYEAQGLDQPKLNGKDLTEIDPFTVFGLFNKFFKSETRRKILAGFKDALNISAEVPDKFDGMPLVSNFAVAFFDLDHNDGDIANLWEVFDAALSWADDPSEASRARFITAFDTARTIKGVKWNITMALFWVRPFSFVNLDSRSRWFITKCGGLNDACSTAITDTKDEPLKAEDYLRLCNAAKACLGSGAHSYSNFPELSYEAWVVSEEENERIKAEEETDGSDSVTANQHIVDAREPDIETPENPQAYSKEDFLREVYLGEREHDRLTSLLRSKKNVILQGAPGVGKTFMAKRLAYAMMGCKDSARIKFVQFHQSYSYEDFIMGYRPSSEGFELKTGAFYNFCKLAAADPGHSYFFIIDEINRGNLSKIFGELFMLIEPDKRDESLQLLYTDEHFSVPGNLYIIGMMNTADRSLAMMDYALRRRFAFYEVCPAFDSEGFRTYQANLASDRFDHLIATVEQLNGAIERDDSLGRGFRIGHSYFCNIAKNDSGQLEQALEQIVDFELVPLLEEYWFDEPSNVADWSARLHDALR